MAKFKNVEDLESFLDIVDERLSALEKKQKQSDKKFVALEDWFKMDPAEGDEGDEGDEE